MLSIKKQYSKGSQCYQYKKQYSKGSQCYQYKNNIYVTIEYSIYCCKYENYKTN